MGAGADAAYPLGEGPGVARITTAQDGFNAAPHRAGRNRVADHVAGIEVDLDPEVALDPGYGIDDDTLAGIVEIESVRSSGCP